MSNPEKSAPSDFDDIESEEKQIMLELNKYDRLGFLEDFSDLNGYNPEDAIFKINSRRNTSRSNLDKDYQDIEDPLYYLRIWENGY